MKSYTRFKHFSLSIFVCVFACQASGLFAADNSFDSLWEEHKGTARTAGIGFGVALGLYGLGRLAGIDLGKHGPELATGAGILLGGTTGIYLAMRDAALESNLQAVFFNQNQIHEITKELDNLELAKLKNAVDLIREVIKEVVCDDEFLAFCGD